VDWSREYFTMDENLSRAVREAFVRLHEEGLIYRGKYIVNWCPRCETAISDLEVKHEEIPGKLYEIRYPVIGTSEFITVATTRPETMLGDTAVAVNERDERYKHLHGKKVLLPLMNHEIPIITDELAQPEFGTGAVKVTPAHDPNDFEAGLRHNLPQIEIMDQHARMNENAGPYAGLDRYAARKRVLEDLQAQGFFVGEKSYTIAIGKCDRCGTVVEPRLSTQWFIKIQPLAARAIEVVERDYIRFTPANYRQIYLNWMRNIHDWCISRQLWWGHRIPLYYCDAPGCGELWASVDEPERCRKCGSTLFHQDPDVLDTWFSSGLWPFSTLGWPDETRDLQTFYPTSVMETGHDILFFWVARMIMFGLEFTGQAPFHTVYLHGLIRAEGGVKMSKTKGNVQDPLELIDEYGTDALRLGVTIGVTPGNDFTLTSDILDSRRDFVNKLWNIGRFVMASTTPEVRRRALEPAAPKAGAPLAERWIASRLASVTADVTRMLGEFNFGEAARVIHDFIWDEVADWYVEAFKVLARGGQADGALLAQIFEKLLRLLHPFAPFATEELWQRITTGISDRPIALMIAEWPRPIDNRDASAEADWSDIMALTRAIRTLRGDYHIEPSKVVAASIVPGSRERADFWQAQADLLGALPGTRLNPIEILNAPLLAAQSIATVAGGVELLIPAEGLFDVEAELARTDQELSNAQKQLQRLEGLLGSDFSSKAPPETVAHERGRLEEQRERQQTLERRRATLSRLGGGDADGSSSPLGEA